MSQHEQYIKKCLRLAQQGMGKVAPNPMVGCVIVHEDTVVGTGFHEYHGGPHAEVNAIQSVKDKTLLEKSVLYVNLEPCSHFGKTPPCTDLLIRYKIPKVVIGTIDPNNHVQGSGIEKLKAAGCEVLTGVLEQHCNELNKRFFTYHKKNRPYVILKWAQTKDGFIDSKRSKENPGSPTLISNEFSIQLVHKWRSEEQAIMVGTTTALLDNPRLTVREWKGKNPLRIAIDRNLKIPKNYHLFDRSAPTLIFTQEDKPPENNIEFSRIDFEQPVLNHVFKNLFHREVQSLIVEGGEKLLSAFIQNNCWDEARVFTAQKKLDDGIQAPNLLDGKVVSNAMIFEDDLTIYRNFNSV